MKNILLSIFVILSISACNSTKLNANLEYAGTSLGYRNSGALQEGKVFVWDKSNNTLTDLRTPIALKATKGTNPTDLEATNISGVEITGNADISEESNLKLAAEFSKKVEFITKNAVRLDNYHIYNSLSAAYTAISTNGGDGFSEWRIKDFKADRSRYKLVLTVDPVFATEATLTLKHTKKVGIAAKIKNIVLGKIEIGVPDEASAKCSGENPICFVGLAVLDVFVKSDGNLNYEPSVGYDKHKLSEALRKL